ncbi:gpW family head-tail joining protein [Paraburkholderia sp. C35]|uniref:gpW family head-tail joining protein n=1 Tax=Paraburkholderia sp. C35 TaxID=2126993 RepID=UPI001EF5DB20|nr:gpW family head-tail joining protein [Paraburkholderia sp. C35]
MTKSTSTGSRAKATRSHRPRNAQPRSRNGCRCAGFADHRRTEPHRDGTRSVTYSASNQAHFSALIRQLQQALGLICRRRAPVRFLYR